LVGVLFFDATSSNNQAESNVFSAMLIIGVVLMCVLNIVIVFYVSSLRRKAGIFVSNANVLKLDVTTGKFALATDSKQRHSDITMTTSPLATNEMRLRP
jgi:hypothetical protein